MDMGYSATLLERRWMNLMADIGPRKCFGWAKEELSGMAREDGEAGGVGTGDRMGAIVRGNRKEQRGRSSSRRIVPFALCQEVHIWLA